MSKRQDLRDKEFGKLTALFYAWSEKGKSVWLCACICGRVCLVKSNSLLTLNTTSCGCVKSSRVVKWNIDRSTHGATKTPEYWAYKSAKGRCTNTNNGGYKDWGGRGIKFNFTSFKQFLDCIGPRPSKYHSHHRIDNDGHYEVGNVKWATKEEQANNRRTYHETLIRQIAVKDRRIAELEKALDNSSQSLIA